MIKPFSAEDSITKPNTLVSAYPKAALIKRVLEFLPESVSATIYRQLRMIWYFCPLSLRSASACLKALIKH